MTTLQDLLSQKEAIEKAIDSAKKQHRAEAIAKIRSLMTDYGLTTADLSGKVSGKASSGKGNKVAAKYRNAATGESWSGRGLQPKWLKAALAAGSKIEDFVV